MDTKRVLKVTRCSWPSAGALCAFKEGKYFSCLLKPNCDRRTIEGKKLMAEWRCSRELAIVENILRSPMIYEYHHFDMYKHIPAWGYMVHLKVLRELGWTFRGRFNKEVVLENE